MENQSLKVVSFNVNGIRARLHQLEAVIDSLAPDVIGLQETKVTDEEFPLADIQSLGYEVTFHGQKGHYGVALLSKKAPEYVCKGFPDEALDSQRRLIVAGFVPPNGKRLHVINGYFPQGESRDHPTKFPNKQQFYSNLSLLLTNSFKPSDHLIIMGDMNISPEDIDIGIGDENRKRWLRSGKCSFLPEEREWYQTLLSWGVSDCFRKHFPASNADFSWFDYRSRGFEREPKRGLRIDHILATAPLQERCNKAGIDYSIRAMQRPSDHAPVWASFSFA